MIYERFFSEKKQEQEKVSALTLLFFLSGVFGILLLLQGVNGVFFNIRAAGLAAVPFCFFLWFFWQQKKAVFWSGILAAALMCSGLSVLFHDSLKLQADYVLQGLLGENEAENMEITGLVLLLSVLLSFLIFTLEFIWNMHLPVCLIITVLLFSSPFIRVRISFTAFLLLLLFQGAFLVIHFKKKKSKRRKLIRADGYRIQTKTAALSAVFLFILTILFSPLVENFSDSLYQSVYDAEGFVYRTVSNLSGQSQDPITGGKISRGNNYRTGTVHLELTVSRQPSETLYLRGFGGGEYIGGDWIRSSDEALFEQMQETLDWGEWSSMISGMYYSMYYVMNGNMQDSDESDPISLEILHSSGNYENIYVPYYSQRNGTLSRDGQGSSSGYTYEYYEQQDMEIDWENASQEFSEQADWYRQLQDAYIQQAQTAYTQVPEEILPRLTELVKENPLDELNDITAFILYTLDSHAVYSLTPGWAPLNEDIVEYFLFEGHIGYCEHFAAAATLMYRLYGIPARYASGYMVDPEDFVRQEDGSYRAEVTDESAHAWAEIFLPEYGWTPVEVTPASDGSMSASYPGFEETESERLLQQYRQDDLQTPILSGTESTARQEDAETSLDFSLPDGLRNVDMGKYRSVFLVIGSCLAYTFLLIPLFLDYRRLRRRRKMEDMDCRKIFNRLISMVHWCGALTDMDGTESDFADRLKEAVPDFQNEELDAFLKSVCDAAYGPDLPSRRDNERALRVYRYIAGKMQGGLTFWKKLIFRYIKAF